MTYPCERCNMDDGSPVCLQDERCPSKRPALERTELWKCDDCGHTGDGGGSTTESYCGACGATVPYPKEDRCQECGATNCMLIACPECGGRYWEHDECGEPPNARLSGAPR